MQKIQTISLNMERVKISDKKIKSDFILTRITFWAQCFILGSYENTMILIHWCFKYLKKKTLFINLGLLCDYLFCLPKSSTAEHKIIQKFLISLVFQRVLLIPTWWCGQTCIKCKHRKLPFSFLVATS